MNELEKEIFDAAVKYAKSYINLAKRLKVSQQTVRNWRKNVSRPRQEYIDMMILLVAEKPNG